MGVDPDQIFGRAGRDDCAVPSYRPHGIAPAFLGSTLIGLEKK
jgi:hypothetical protein